MYKEFHTGKKKKIKVVVLDLSFFLFFLTSGWDAKRILSSKLFLMWGNSLMSGVLGRVRRSKFRLININNANEAFHMAFMYACCS